MPLTGYVNATTPGRLILGPMVLFVDDVPHSASRGVRVEFIDETTQPQIDGLVAPMSGVDYRAAVGVRITGQFLEASTAAIARYQSNTTGVVAGGVTTHTPRVPGLYLPSLAGYVEDIEVRFKDGAGNTHAIAVPAAHVVTRSMDGVDGFAVTLEARSTDPEVVPYTYTITSATPVLSSIVIAPDPATVEEGLPTQFTVVSYLDQYNNPFDMTGVPAGAWDSTDEGVATIDASGEATWEGEGLTNITFARGGVTSNVAELTGESAAAVPSEPSLIGAGFDARDVSGDSEMTHGWDTKFGPAPTLRDSNTKIAVLPIAYQGTGVPDLPLLDNVPGDLGLGNVAWDDVLDEINTMGAAHWDMVSVLDASLTQNEPFTFWYVANYLRVGTAPLFESSDRNTGGFSFTARTQLYYRELANDYVTAQMYGPGGAEMAPRSFQPDMTDGTDVALVYFGADPVSKTGWIGVMGDIWSEHSNASYSTAALAMRIHLLNYREAIVRSLWRSRGKPTPAQIRFMQSVARTHRDATYLTNGRIKIIGNSFMVGQGSTGSNGFPQRVEDNLPALWDVHHLATSGINWANLAAEAPTKVDRTFNADRAFEDIILYEWTNSSGLGVSANWEAGRDYIRARKVAYPDIRRFWVGTLLPFNGLDQTYLDDLNALIRANAAAEGYTVIDWAADPAIGPMSAHSNPTYYLGGGDGHPTDVTYGIMYDIAVDAGIFDP